ncbi:MAG: BON domain-containing protein [Marinobacterium sp.]|nr:BON domain-containing protein [Marinobacterium sp.]
MSKHPLKHILLPLAASLLLSGCASVIDASRKGPIQDDRGSRTMGAYIDDEVIETKASVNLAKASAATQNSHISVTSFNGIVLLTGQVPHEEARMEAQNIVSQIQGVRRAHNELTISGNSAPLARTNDTWVTTKVKTLLLANENIDGSRIKVVTENGIVYLMGLISREEGNIAVDIVRSINGVQKIIKVFEYI